MVSTWKGSSVLQKKKKKEREREKKRERYVHFLEGGEEPLPYTNRDDSVSSLGSGKNSDMPR